MSVTDETFAAEVEQASFEIPVVVDFWRDGCRPCARLAALLEKLEPQYAGRLKMVKFDIWAAGHEVLAQRFRISGPQLVVFVDGERMPERMTDGNKPESEVRAFFDAAQTARLPKGQAAELYRKGTQSMKSGDAASGIAELREALALEAGHLEARIALIEALERLPDAPDAARLTEIGELIDGCPEENQGPFVMYFRAMRMRYLCMRELDSMPAAMELRRTAETEPRSIAKRLMLARRCIAEGAFEEAAKWMLECMEATAEQARWYREAVLGVDLLPPLSGDLSVEQAERNQTLRKSGLSDARPAGTEA